MAGSAGKDPLPLDLPGDDDSDSSSSTSLGKNSDEESGSGSGSDGNGGIKVRDLLGSLPGKRGLSEFYDGQSKSFTDLTKVTDTIDSVKDLVKPQVTDPHNLKRRSLTDTKNLRRELKRASKRRRATPGALTIKDDTAGKGSGSSASTAGEGSSPAKAADIPSQAGSTASTGGGGSSSGKAAAAPPDAFTKIRDKQESSDTDGSGKNETG